MALLRTNLIANFAGSFWTAALSLLLVPVYVHLLGVEAYGLVGVHVTLQALFSILDAGLSTSLNRELARFGHDRANDSRISELVFTLEVLYWLVALLIATVTYFCAPLLAVRWLNTGRLQSETVISAIRLIGCVIALQFPFAFYSGGLLGLQRHVAVNTINIVWGTIRGVGAAAALWLVAPLIQVFFGWQLLATAGLTITSAIVFWKSLPAPKRPAFRITALRHVARFAAGMSAITVAGTVLTQIDRVVLSRVLTLEAFGYYTIATTVATVLLLAMAPIFSAVFPKFSQLIALGDDDELRVTYHRSAQVLSVVIIPAAVILTLFSYEVLLAWTGNHAIAANAHLIVTLLTIGYALGGLNQVPYALQLAEGWVRLPLIQSTIAVIFVIPASVWAANRYGGPGAASLWALLNAVFVVTSVAIMHRRLLRGERATWCLRDVGLPLIASLAVAVPARLWIAPRSGQLPALAWLAAIGLLTLTAAAFATPYIRVLMSEALSYVRRRA